MKWKSYCIFVWICCPVCAPIVFIIVCVSLVLLSEYLRQESTLSHPNVCCLRMIWHVEYQMVLVCQTIYNTYYSTDSCTKKKKRKKNNNNNIAHRTTEYSLQCCAWIPFSLRALASVSNNKNLSPESSQSHENRRSTQSTWLSPLCSHTAHLKTTNKGHNVFSDQFCHPL